jgi:hypothetical protein
MSRVVGSEVSIELMVNCKTYPAVSSKYVETVCTGGVRPNGDFVRLYPVPFRFLDTDEQYKRWDVIRVRAYRDTKDQRPESWHIEPGVAIERLEAITTDRQRWEWMKKSVHESAEAMESRKLTNGCVQIEPVEFYWKPDSKEWTPNQMNVIRQGDLFASKEQMLSLADRVPWQFRLKYREKNTGRMDDGKVLAWSYYQGFRRARSRMGTDEEALETIADRVRGSIFNPEKRVFAILGTHSRFGHWMISSLYHVPNEVIEKDGQKGTLLF